MIDKSPIDRLLDFLNYKGIKPATAERMAGLSNGFIKNAGSRTGEIGSDAARKIAAAFLDVSLTWLISGEGEMLKSDNIYADTPHQHNEVSEHITVYTANTPIPKMGVNDGKSAPPTAPATDNKGVNTRVLVPQFITVDNTGKENILHVSVKAAAGYPSGYGDREYLEKLPSFSLPGLQDATYRSFEVDGDSMYPTLKNQQMVIGKWVEKLDHIIEDHVYILVTKTRGIVIKRLLNRISKRNKIVCKSDATNDRGLYKTYQIDPEDIQEIWHAVFHGGFDFQSPSDMWNRVNEHEADITNLQSTVDKLLSVIKTAGLLN